MIFGDRVEKFLEAIITLLNHKDTLLVLMDWDLLSSMLVSRKMREPPECEKEGMRSRAIEAAG